MPYVYTDTSEPVPEGVKIWELPPPEGGWVTIEDGARRLVTKLLGEEDGFPLAPPQDPTAYTKVDLIQELRDQLTRIETAVIPPVVVARSLKSKKKSR